MPYLQLQLRFMIHSTLECLIEVIGLQELLLRPLQVLHLLFLGTLRVELAKRLADVEGPRGEHRGHIRIEADLSCLHLVELKLGQGRGHI